VKVHGDITKLQNYTDALKKEIVALRGLSHPNIVKYYSIDIFENKEENYSISYYNLLLILKCIS